MLIIFNSTHQKRSLIVNDYSYHCLVSMKFQMFVLWTFLAFSVSFTLAQDYLGCYKYFKNEPDSLTIAQAWPSSPSQCATECKRRYFMFAGLMRGQLCFCGSTYGRNGLSNDCTIPCNSDPASFCGSDEAVSIYSTGQKGPSPPRRVQVAQSTSTALLVTWEPPDNPNGNVTLYTLRAVPVTTHASYPLFPSQTKVQGGTTNSTMLISLHPGTKYNVSVTAVNTNDESEAASVLDWTLIGPPEKPELPEILERTETNITIILPKGRSENGPVSSYQVVVVERFIIPPTGDDVTYTNFYRTENDSLGYYITGEFDGGDYQKYEKFVVGDGKTIGGYYNAPLKGRFVNAQIGVVVVSKVGTDVKYSYSNLANGRAYIRPQGSQVDSTVIGLCIAIAFLGVMLVASVLAYFGLRRRYTQNRMTKLPEQQELTLQGPVYEVDNMAYIPEDVPERANHYQSLKERLWSIPKNFLNIDSTVIRRGRFGTVHMGTVQKNGITSTAVVHCITDTSLKASEKKHMLRDLDACIKAGSMKNLANLVGTCETPDSLYIVFEMPPQTLKGRLVAARSGDVFPTDKILLIAASIASALRHLEIQKIVHTHLCSRSIGLHNDFTPKVMGYGIGRFALEDIKYARWTAVECFSKQKKSPQGVVWAFGVLVWEMLSMGGTPYANLPTEIDVEEAVDQGAKLPQLRDTPDPLYEVLLSCWQLDPEERPTFEELVRLNTLSLVPITAITEPYIAELELH